jgi:hypothetical protein
MISTRYNPGDKVLSGAYTVQRVLKISDHHEIYAVDRSEDSSLKFALKIAVSEDGRKQISHEAFVLDKLNAIPGVVRLEQASEDALVLSLHGEPVQEGLRFSQVGKLLLRVLDSLVLIHGEGVVLQNIAPRHLLTDEKFPIVICDLSAVCKEDSVAEDVFPGDYISPALHAGTRKRVCFLDDFWALIFTGLELAGIPMSWRDSPVDGDSLVLKLRFIQDARNSALGDVHRGLQVALALLAEIEESSKPPIYTEVVARLKQALTQLVDSESIPPVPEALLVLAQDRVCPGVFTRISANAVLLAALDARARDIQRVRSDFASFSEYGNILQDLLRRENPGNTRPVEKVLQRDTMNTCGFLYAIPGSRAAVCSLGPVCLFALITGSCRVREWCPLVHPQVPVSLPEIKNRKRKLCFRFVGTGACPNGPRCDKIHPLRADMDQWIFTGRLNDRAAHERRSPHELFEFDDHVLKVDEDDGGGMQQSTKMDDIRSRSISRRRESHRKRGPGHGGRRDDLRDAKKPRRV